MLLHGALAGTGRRGGPTRATIYSRLETQIEEPRTRLTALVDTGMSLTALRAAARRGRLEATQRSDGQWLSTRRAVEQYMESRPRSG